MVRIPGVGSFDVAKLEASVGRIVQVGGKSFLVLRASSRDLRGTMERGAQTLTPKDLAAILYEADVVSGARVVEAGAGSGGLTVALARVVAPSGRVYSYDNREEALAVARRNVERAGLSSVVEFGLGDVRERIEQPEVDAVILDLADPWAVVGVAWDALRSCGHLATFTPNMEQVKETVAAIRKRPFVDVRTIELIEREMEVRDVGVRPSFAALGHTGYLTFARKVLDTF
jgi:tRNA (adenine57-N1/adenine58-N1)-methyltransferase